MIDVSLRLLLLIFIFATVLLAVEGVAGLIQSRRTHSSRINKRLSMIGEGTSREEVYSRLRRKTGNSLGNLPGPLGIVGKKLETTLNATGTGWAVRNVLAIMLLSIVGIIVITLLLALAKGFVLTLGMILLLLTFAFALGFGIPMMVLSRMADRRRKKMQEQFPTALDIFVRGLRAGHPVSAALLLLTEEMADPIGSEFGLVVDEVTYGADLRDALQNMADRWDMQDMHMFVVSLSIQAETGGNLAEILENLAVVIRERASMMMKVRALSSEGRMTAIILTGLPVMAFVGLFLLNPAFYLDVAQDPVFIIGYGILLFMYAIGFYAIRRLIDLKV
jgi:tight adherence protein B